MSGGTVAWHCRHTLIVETAERTWAAVERARAEAELRAVTDELERFSNTAVGRERRMGELQKDIKALLARLGEPAKDQIARKEARV
jgi:hypothetical protein